MPRFDGSRFMEHAERFMGPKARKRRSEERVAVNRRIRRAQRELQGAAPATDPAPNPPKLAARGKESREERLARRAKGIGRP